MAFAYIKDGKTLGRKIASIGKRGKTLDTDIHVAACSSLFHAVIDCGNGEGSGDPRHLALLMNAMPQGSRVQALAKWARDHAPVTVEFDKAKGWSAKCKAGWKDLEQSVEAACETPFWAHSEESVKAKPWTAEQLIRQLTLVAKGGTDKRPADKEVQRMAAKALKGMGANASKAKAVVDDAVTKAQSDSAKSPPVKEAARV